MSEIDFNDPFAMLESARGQAIMQLVYDNTFRMNLASEKLQRRNHAMYRSDGTLPVTKNPGQQLLPLPPGWQERFRAFMYGNEVRGVDNYKVGVSARQPYARDVVNYGVTLPDSWVHQVDSTEEMDSLDGIESDDFHPDARILTEDEVRAHGLA